MTAPALPRTDVDLEIIESLDFEHTPACEHSEHGKPHASHGGPAVALVRSIGHGCLPATTLYVCEPFLVRVSTQGFLCRSCRAHRVTIADYTVLAYVGSR